MAIYTIYGNKVRIIGSTDYSRRAFNGESTNVKLLTIELPDGAISERWNYELRADGGMDEIDAAVEALMGRVVS